MTSIAIHPDQDLFCASHNRIRIYLKDRYPHSLTASFEKLKETDDFFLVRELSELPDQLFILHLRDLNKVVALRGREEAEYLSLSLVTPLHGMNVPHPELSAGFLSRWTMGETLRGTSYGVIELESECGIFSLTIARESDTEGQEPEIIITLFDTEMDSFLPEYFESERKGTLRIFGDRFRPDASSQVTRWRWDYESWNRWLRRFRDDLAEEICLETDGMLLRFHITRMFQSHFTTSQKGERP